MSFNANNRALIDGLGNENQRLNLNKERSHSESPHRGNNINFNMCDPNDLHTLTSADIYSWKLKKGSDGVIYAVYCIHVSLKSGMKWLVEKRYTQFRELRKEIKRVWPDLAQLEFPKKRWMFNLSKAALKERQAVLNAYLSELMEARPQPLEVAIFLEVEINVGGIQLAGATLSQRRANSGVDTVDALLSLRRRTLSFPAVSATDGVPAGEGAVSLHDFHLIKVLGKGSFGKVFLVRPILAPAEQVYAMKVLRKSEVVKRHQVEHTMTERSILATIQHPFVLALRYAFQNEHKLYMVTDYCPGGELFFHLKKLRRFTEGMMRFYSSEIALALAHLHAHSIVYRDLKPENVLLDKNGHVKLTDFGLSKRVTSFALGTMEASTATFCGTPEYLSPEMIVHRRSGTGYSKEVDWWALGIVCFELLTGWPPFYDRDFTKMCEKILYKPLVFPVKKYNITKEAEAVIKGLLTRDFTKRMYFEPPITFGIVPTPSSSTATTVANASTTSAMASAAIPTATASAKEGAKTAKNGTAGANTGNSKLNMRLHSFYADMDWAALIKKQVIPPFVPPMGRDILDTRNFEKEFTKLTVKESPNSSITEQPSAKSTAAADKKAAAAKKKGAAAANAATTGSNNSLSAEVGSQKPQSGSQASGTGRGSSQSDGPDQRDQFAGFSYNGHSAPGASSSGAVLLEGDAPATGPATGTSAGAARSSTGALTAAPLSPAGAGAGLYPGSAPSSAASERNRSSRDREGGVPQLALLSSNGNLSTVIASPARKT